MGSQMFDTNKLYHKDGFTVVEFFKRTNKRQQQARVAICVLHRRDNRHVNEQLVKGYPCPKAYGGINSGATQANLHMLVQGDPVVDGSTHIPQFGSTINQASCNEVAQGIYPGAIQASLPMDDVQPVLQIYSACTVGELGNGPQFSDTIGQLTSTSEGGGYHRFPANFLMNPSTLILGTDANTYDNTWASTVATVPLDANDYDNMWESNVATSVGYHAAHSMISSPTLCTNGGMENTTMDAMNSAYNPALNYGMNIPAWYMNGIMSDMPMSDSSTISFGNSIDAIMPNQYATLPEQDALTDQNNSSITYSVGNSMGTPNENTMTSENEPLRWNYFEDDHFSFPEFWEPNSTFETNDNEPLLEHFPPAEYSAPTTHNCPLDEFQQFCDFF